MKKIYTDKFGNKLNVGDTVHNKYGYDLIVYEDEYGDYYGKLVCEPGDSCENIPYSLEPTTDIELIKKDVTYTAEKFFELGLKAQKGE